MNWTYCQWAPPLGNRRLAPRLPRYAARSRRPHWPYAAPAVLSALFASQCLAQHNELAAKLKDLKVRVQTQHYILAGSASDARMTEYAMALEAIHREYDKGFATLFAEEAKGGGNSPVAAKTEPAKPTKPAEAPATQPSGDKRRPKPPETGDPPPRTLDQPDTENRFTVIIFNTESEYQAFGKEFLRGQTDSTTGKFIPSLDLLLIRDQGNTDDTYEVLFHEAFHQFMHRYLKNPPTWLNEGLAVYYGSARPTARGLAFSRPPANRWKLVRKLIEKHKALSLWQVVSADSATFYDRSPERVSGFDDLKRRNLYYAQAYTLVHLLLSDAGGRERLRNYVRALAQAGPQPAGAVTREFFGPDVCEYLTPIWEKYVKSNPENK